MSWTSRTGQDSFGNDTFAAAADVDTRVDSDEIGTGNQDRQEQQTGMDTRTVELIMAVNTVDVRDLITYDSVEFTVETVVVFSDEDGPHHQTVTMTSDKKA